MNSGNTQKFVIHLPLQFEYRFGSLLSCRRNPMKLKKNFNLPAVVVADDDVDDDGDGDVEGISFKGADSI